MAEITIAKRLAVIRLYLSGLSYDDISARTGVSKGSIANIVAELKAGRFPETSNVTEHIEELRELSIDLKRLKFNPLQCATGLTVLARVRELGLEPADIDRWPMILKSIKKEDDALEFVRVIYSVVEVQKRTGLSLNDLDNRVHELEKKAAGLGPAEDRLKQLKKQASDLTKEHEKLKSSVSELEHKYNFLNPRVRDLEKRDKDLTHRINDLEPRARKAELTLNNLNKETIKLRDIGLPIEKLSRFTQKIQDVAKHHGIDPGNLCSRLLHELENLDEGLGLEALIKSQQEELASKEEEIASTDSDLKALKSAVKSLRQEKANLEASIKEIRDVVAKEIATIIPLANDTVSQFGKELRDSVDKCVTEVIRLKDESLKVGKEVGTFQGILGTNLWLKELQGLAQGEYGIEAGRVKAIALLALRGISGWLKVQNKFWDNSVSLSLAVDSLIKELEKWKA